MPDAYYAPTAVELVDHLLLLPQGTPVYLDDDSFAYSCATGDYVSLSFVLGEMEAAAEETTADVERSVEHAVVVLSSVTGEQFATFLRMCGLPPERLKQWVNDREPTRSGRFRFDVPTDVFAHVVGFAQEAGLYFRTETTVASTYRPRTAPR